ncbi:hypothetical protein A2U01_0026901, partial [Trifolium medium]|nr:hypothetical protein [Trifolium medium]
AATVRWKFAGANGAANQTWSTLLLFAGSSLQQTVWRVFAVSSLGANVQRKSLELPAPVRWGLAAANPCSEHCSQGGLLRLLVDFLGFFAPETFLHSFSRRFSFRGLFVELRNACWVCLLENHELWIGCFWFGNG